MEGPVRTLPRQVQGLTELLRFRADVSEELLEALVAQLAKTYDLDPELGFVFVGDSEWLTIFAKVSQP